MCELCAQVHYPPYLFEAFLFQPIVDVGSSARVTDTAVFLRLQKKTSEPWKDLLTDAGIYVKNATMFRLALKKSCGHFKAVADAARTFHRSG